MIDINMEEEDNAQQSADVEMEDVRVQKLDTIKKEEKVEDTADVRVEEFNKQQRAVQNSTAPSLVQSQREERPNQPDQRSNLPFRSNSPGWSEQPDNRPQTFNFNARVLFSDAGICPVPRMNPVPRKSKKRDSDGNIKEMIAELNARTELVISRETTPSPTPRGRRPERALPSPGCWRWDTLGLSPLMCRPSPVSPQRMSRLTKTSSYTNSRDINEQDEKFQETEDRKRKGSLLEWRNEEMFEEPVRI